jgi:hypothetical protein
MTTIRTRKALIGVPPPIRAGVAPFATAIVGAGSRNDDR